MSYIGNSPALKYASFAVQHFTTSATTGYTLDNAVTNENGIALFINNVRQQPGSSYAYTASGTTLTLSAATTSSDTMYCVFIGKAVQTVNPPAGSVAASQLNDDAISGQGALGAEPADTDEFLVSDAGTLKRVDYSYIKGITQTSFLPSAQPIFYNGDANVSQRGDSTGITNANSGYYGPDRYKFNEDGTMTAVLSISQETLTSGNAFDDGFERALKYDVTTADASVAADIYARIEQRFEKGDLSLFKKGTSNAETYTLAFWVKATVTGTNVVELQDQVNTRHCCASYTISSTDTWEHKVLNFAADTSGPLGTGTGLGMNVNFALQAGTNYTSGTLATAWASSTDANRAVGQVNNFSSTSNNFHLTGIQLEVGTYTSSTIPPFQHESYGDNYDRCLRYYYRITPVSGLRFVGWCQMDNDDTNHVAYIDFKKNLRVPPTALEQSGTASHYKIREGTTTTCDAVPTFNNADIWYAAISFKKDSSGFDQGELNKCGIDGGYLGWSAEL